MLTAIVRENGLSRTVPGVVAVSAAGVLDAICWTVLAGALLEAGAGTAPEGVSAGRGGCCSRSATSP